MNSVEGDISALLVGRHISTQGVIGAKMEKGVVSDLFKALIPVGTVEAVRQEYQVFRSAGGDYLVFSPSSRGTSSFHMTVIGAEKVEALAAAVGKHGVTTGSLMKDGKLEEEFGPGDKVATRFDMLIGLYVLTAMGRVEMEKEGRNLVFRRKEEGA